MATSHSAKDERKVRHPEGARNLTRPLAARTAAVIEKRAAARALRLLLGALDVAQEQAQARGILDVPLSTCPRDTWRHRFPALRQHPLRFIGRRYGTLPSDR